VVVADVGPAHPTWRTSAATLSRSLCDELLDGEVFYTLREAEIVIESRRRHDYVVRRHGSIG